MSALRVVLKILVAPVVLLMLLAIWLLGPDDEGMGP